MTCDHPLSFTMDADARRLPVVRCWANAVFSELIPGASDEDRHAFVLAVHEAAQNVIEHGYEGAHGSIHFEAAPHGSSLSVVLTHDGRPFSGEASEPCFDGGSDRGFGLFLMRRAVSRVDHRTTPAGRQQIELIKHIPEDPQGHRH